MIKAIAKSNFTIFLLSVFSNSWIFFISKNSLFITFLLVVINFTLISAIKTEKKKWLVLLAILTVIVTAITVGSSFKKGDWQYDSTRTTVMRSRHFELSNGLGPLYKNKFSTLYLQKYLPIVSAYFRNTFENLDLNLFFLATHPRERSNVYEYERYWIITLPIFFIGLFDFFKNPSKILFYYLLIVIIISGLISDSYLLGPILYFPIINTFLYIGLGLLLNSSKKFNIRK